MSARVVRTGETPAGEAPATGGVEPWSIAMSERSGGARQKKTANSVRADRRAYWAWADFEPDRMQGFLEEAAHHVSTIRQELAAFRTELADGRPLLSIAGDEGADAFSSAVSATTVPWLADPNATPLRRARKASGLTQREVHDATGIPVRTLSRLESGAQEAKLTQLRQLARLYHTTLDRLVGDET
jgi:DNA-binding XRE family transcriptional regulator